MKILDKNISNDLLDNMPIESFLFNPSLAHLVGDIFMITVRSYRHRLDLPMDYNRNPYKNTQHPWSTEWDANQDYTYVFPAIVTKESFTPLLVEDYPIRLDCQDARIYRFVKTDNKVAFILTYNEEYNSFPDMLIKSGDSCDDYCYIIGWSYLIVDKDTLEYTHIPGKQPLCKNISNPVEKNWSLWSIVSQDDTLNLFTSYELTPHQSVFSLDILGVKDGEMMAKADCKMLTYKKSSSENVLCKLEKYYEDNLFVSLSTPSYVVNESEYQAVGHIKVRIDYINKHVNQSRNTPLARFSKQYMKDHYKIIQHPTYVYFMFIYRFEVYKIVEEETLELNSESFKVSGDTGRMKTKITRMTPAFVCNVDDYDYLLNFPSGMAIHNNETIISYGNADFTSHLMFIPNKDVEQLMVPMKYITPDNFQFKHFDKVNGYIQIPTAKGVSTR